MMGLAIYSVIVVWLTGVVCRWMGIADPYAEPGVILVLCLWLIPIWTGLIIDMRKEIEHGRQL